MPWPHEHDNGSFEWETEELDSHHELGGGTDMSADDFFSIDTDDIDLLSSRDDRTPLGESLDFLAADDSLPSLHSFGYPIASDHKTMINNTEGHRGVSFSDSVMIPDDEHEINENSMTMENLFGSSSIDFQDDATSTSSDSNVSEEDEDTRIKKQLMFAAGGMGMMALVGWGVQKLKSIFEKNKQEDNMEGGGDLLSNLTETNMPATGDGGASAVSGGSSGSSSATAIASKAYVEAMSASVAQASESQLLAGAGFALGYSHWMEHAHVTGTMPLPALSSYRIQVMQSMAVSAAGNVTSGAAITSTAVAGVAASATAATATATVTTLALVRLVGPEWVANLPNVSSTSNPVL